MTTTVSTPDLQRIVEALKACRERYEIWGTHPAVRDVQAFENVFSGTYDQCEQWIDARCAEAMVRAIREPSDPIVHVGFLQQLGDHDEVLWLWHAMCDAILGETQP
jgi:hypothetical protein